MRHTPVTAMVAALALSPIAANAQQQAPADQHQGHGPGQTQAAPAAPGMMGGGMMGGGMSHGMMGGMHGKHIEAGSPS